MVIGFVNDKDVSHILEMMPKGAEYYFTQATINRAMPARDLASLAESKGLSGQMYPTVEKAYSAALNDASENDTVFIGGSTFIVADLLSSISE